jgi:hypothetical protein
MNMITLGFLMMLIGFGVHDDGYLPIQYGGSWLLIEDEYAHSGWYRTSANGSLSFDFYGDAFAVYAPKSDTFGTGEICIDDLDCVIVDWNAGTFVHGLEIYGTGEMELGVHNVTITAIDTIAIDAIYIPVPPPIETVMPDWIVDGEGSRFEYRADGGQVVIVILLVAILIAVLFFGAVGMVKE